MMFDGRVAALAAGGYLIGAIPFGAIISKVFYKKDIRLCGSGNTGATNVWRVLGPMPGVTTLILDVLKGVIPALIAKRLFPTQPLVQVLCGLTPIVGHNWSLFLRGKGGKGVATSAGVFLSLLPIESAFAIAAFIIVFLLTKHVSLGSMAGALALTIASFWFGTYGVFRALVLLAAIMILIKHIPNMRRLAKGTEPKVKF